MGFYEENGSEDALGVFKNSVPKDVYSGMNSDEYLRKNRVVTENDARDLDRMKESLEAIVELNKIRQERRGIDGRELAIVGISDFEMAVAQGNANYSEDLIGHAVQYNPPYENLAWGYRTARQALEGWYDEKALFDYLRDKGYKSRTEMDAALQNNAELRQEVIAKGYGYQVGHYTNIVDDLMWGGGFGGQDSVVAGYAIRPAQMHGIVQSMVLSPRRYDLYAKSKVYSVEEYKERFYKYYNNLKATVNGKAIITEEDQEAIDAAKALVDELKNKLAKAEKELQAEKEKLNTINNNLSEKEKSLAELNSAIAENEDKIKQLDTKKASNIEAIDSLEKDLTAINKELSTLKEENKDYQTKHDNLSNDIKEKQEKLNNNKAEIASKSASVNKLSEDIKNKEDDLANIDQKRAQLNGQIAELEGEIANLNKEKETKAQEIEDIEKSLDEEKAKESKLSDEYYVLASDLEEAKDALELSENERKQKQNKLNSIEKDLKDISNLEEKLASLTKEIENLEKKAKDLENAKNLNKEKLEKTKEDLKDLDKKLSDLDKIDLNNTETLKDYKDLSEKYGILKNLRADKEEKEDKLKALEENDEEIKDDLAKLEEIYKNKLALTEIARQTWLSYFKDVEIDANGGLIQGESKIKVKKYYNDEIILGLPQRLGYKFINWLANGNKYLAGSRVKVTDEMIFTAIWEKISIPQVDASGDNNKNNTTKPSDKNKSDNKDKSNKNNNKTGDNSKIVAKNINENNATDKSNKKNPKTGITSILAEVNALVALMFGYKNLKKKDWKIANLHD